MDQSQAPRRAALAHLVGNHSAAADASSDLFERRQRLMDDRAA